MPCVAARHGHYVARYVGPCGLFLDQTAIQRPFNGHLTKFLGEQVASLVTLLIQAKKSPAAVGMPVAPVPTWACAIKYLQKHPEIGLFWAVFSHKKPLCCVVFRYVALCCGHGHYVALC